MASSLWYNKRRNILIILWFFLLLFLLISVTIISIVSSRQVSDLNRTVGNSVIISKENEKVGVDPFYPQELKVLKDHPSIESYNAVAFGNGQLLNANPVLKDKKRFEELKADMEKMGYGTDTCKLFGVTDSKAYTLFTSGGFSLTAGRHIAIDNANDHVVLISTAMAKENNLKIGDSISINATWELTSKIKFDPLPLTIIGLFDYPESSELYQKDLLFDYDQPANYVFIPEDTLEPLFNRYYSPYQFFAYLKDAGQAEGFINDMKKALGDSYNDPAAGGTFNYAYKWDKEWFSTVSKPAAEISNMATTTAAVLGIGIFAIILLIFALLLNGKKYELGIYLTLGESKAKLVIHTVLEELVLLLIALCLACIIGMIAAPSVSRIVMDKPATETNAAIEQKREDIMRHENNGQYLIEKDIRSARTTFYYVNDELNVNGSIGTFMIYLSAGIMILIVALAGQVLFFLRKSPAKLLITK